MGNICNLNRTAAPKLEEKNPYIVDQVSTRTIALTL